ncbi:MAG: xylulokinase [Chloroflexota bacterium]
MSQPLILAIDAGSSFLKTVVFDRAGQIVGRTRLPYVTRRRAPGLAEQDPDTWLDLTVESVAQLRRAGIELDQIAGLGLSGRGALAIFLDAAGRALAPCWLDRRSGDAARALAERVGADLDYQTRSLASKTYHLKLNHPDAFARLARPLFLKDFLLYRLTGAAATDPSSVISATGWPKNVWEAVGFPVEQLAPIRQHTEIGGTLSGRMADRLGLPVGLPVGVGGHDGACANAGAGAIRPGQICLTMGTQGVARAIAAAPPDNARPRRISPYPFLPGRWCCSGDLVLAGAAPTLVARLLDPGPSTTNQALHERFTAAARAVPSGANGVIYLPFPGGQVSPDLRRDARAALIGMSAETTPAELYRAALEGVAFAFRSVVEREREVGLALDDIRLTGGGAENELWVQIMADVLNAPLTIVEPEEGARGAAMFLAVGLGWFGSPEEAADAWVRPVRRVEPGGDAVTYGHAYRRFRRLADAVYVAESSVDARGEPR